MDNLWGKSCRFSPYPFPSALLNNKGSGRAVSYRPTANAYLGGVTGYKAVDNALLSTAHSSFNHQFVVGENESILIGLAAALGLGLRGIGRLGLN